MLTDFPPVLVSVVRAVLQWRWKVHQRGSGGEDGPKLTSQKSIVGNAFGNWLESFAAGEGFKLFAVSVLHTLMW